MLLGNTIDNRLSGRRGARDTLSRRRTESGRLAGARPILSSPRPAGDRCRNRVVGLGLALFAGDSLGSSGAYKAIFVPRVALAGGA
jgi:hypothetical protein